MKLLAGILVIALWVHMLVNTLPKSFPSVNEDSVDRRERAGSGHQLRLSNATQAWHVDPLGQTSPIPSGSAEAGDYCPYDPGGSERLLGRTRGEPRLHGGDVCWPEDGS